jgi:hypothetical protein
VSRVLGRLIEDEYRLGEGVIVSLTVLHLPLTAVTLSKEGLHLLSKHLPDSFHLGSVTISSVDLSFSCVYCIPYEMSISLSGLHISMQELDVCPISCQDNLFSSVARSGGESSTPFLTSSGAFGLITSWVSNCLNSLVLNICDLSVELKHSPQQSHPPLYLSAIALRLHPKAASEDEVSKVVVAEGVRLVREGITLFSHLTHHIELVVHACTGEQGWRITSLTICSPDLQVDICPDSRQQLLYLWARISSVSCEVDRVDEVHKARYNVRLANHDTLAQLKSFVLGHAANTASREQELIDKVGY